MNTHFSLDSKVIFIAGASSGLGRHFALTLAKAGADVVVAARRLELLNETVKEIEALGRRAKAITCDVLDEAKIQNAVTQVFKDFGKIDVLINCAGSTPLRKSSLDYTSEEWDGLLDTHLKGSWLLCQQVAKLMIANKIAGSIINISSAMGQHTRKNALVYSVAKAGVNQLTKALALDLSPFNIRVNAIAPGWFVTDFNRELLQTEAGQEIKSRIPLNRTGELKELEGPVLLLASNASSYMTGCVLSVDGGYTTNQI